MRLAEHLGGEGKVKSKLHNLFINCCSQCIIIRNIHYFCTNLNDGEKCQSLRAQI